MVVGGDAATATREEGEDRSRRDESVAVSGEEERELFRGGQEEFREQRSGSGGGGGGGGGSGDGDDDGELGPVVAER